MNVLVVTESCFGNTVRVAQAVAAGIASHGAQVTVAPAAERPDPAGMDLLVVGAPTHNRGLPGPASRNQARAKGGQGEDFGVAEWLQTVDPATTTRAAAFDTVTGLGFFNGSAAKRIAAILRRRGLTVVDRANFLVGGQQGPLTDDELARAQQWGASLV